MKMNYVRCVGFSGLSIIMMAGVSACSFHKPPTGANAQAQLPVTSVQVAWWVDSKTKSPALTRALNWNPATRVARAALPVTLPVSTPDRLEIGLNYPTALATIDPNRVLIQLSQENGQSTTLIPRQVVVASQAPDITELLIEIDGLRAGLNGAQGVDLRVLLQSSSGETPLTAIIALRTPPVALRSEQVRYKDSLLEGFEAPEELKRLRLGDQLYRLLQIKRVRNDSRFPIELRIPKAARANLEMVRVSYTVTPNGPCGFDASLAKKSVVLSNDIQTLALTDALPKMTADLESASFTSVVVPPSGEAKIGIYASGPAAQALTDGHFEKRKPEKIKVTDHCEARCDHKRMGANEFPLCWNGGRSRLYGIPQSQVQSCFDCAGGNQKACETCRAWEIGTAPNYEQAGPNCLFCGELAEIGHFDDVKVWKAIPEWRVEPNYIDNALSGDEDQAVSLVADPASAPLLVRYADGSFSDDPEGRPMAVLQGSTNEDPDQD